MTYRGLTFPVNPQSVALQLGRRTAIQPLLHGKAVTQSLGEAASVISGTGILAGEDAPQRAARLIRLFKEEGGGFLFTPLFPPVRMLFTELHLTANAERGWLEFRFSFTEEREEKKSRYDYGFTYARAGETLYDIANRSGAAVETLFKKNRYPDLFSVREGDKVWLK